MLTLFVIKSERFAPVETYTVYSVTKLKEELLILYYAIMPPELRAI